jgi:hypothetical protein
MFSSKRCGRLPGGRRGLGADVPGKRFFRWTNHTHGQRPPLTLCVATHSRAGRFPFHHPALNLRAPARLRARGLTHLHRRAAPCVRGAAAPGTTRGGDRLGAAGRPDDATRRGTRTHGVSCEDPRERAQCSPPPEPHSIPHRAAPPAHAPRPFPRAEAYLRAGRSPPSHHACPPPPCPSPPPGMLGLPARYAPRARRPSIAIPTTTPNGQPRRRGRGAPPHLSPPHLLRSTQHVASLPKPSAIATCRLPFRPGIRIAGRTPPRAFTIPVVVCACTPQLMHMPSGVVVSYEEKRRDITVATR